MNPMRHLPQSQFLISTSLALLILLYRERREQRVFQALLQMTPGLEQHLMEGTEEDVVAIAEKVSFK